MSHEANLLRMLEPAVRPGNVPAPASRGVAPIEQRDFEALLAEANGPTGDADESASADGTGSPLRRGLLEGLGRIENESLRQLLSARDVGVGQGADVQSDTR